MAKATLLNVTIADNRASSGGGIFVGNGTAQLKNSPVADSGSGGDCAGTINSQGYNLIESTTGCTVTGVTTGNITGQDPRLSSLASNGGPTKTHALRSGSPAIDKGTNTDCPSKDQRGVERPLDGDGDGTATCGIGAFEAPRSGRG